MTAVSPLRRVLEPILWFAGLLLLWQLVVSQLCCKVDIKGRIFAVPYLNRCTRLDHNKVAYPLTYRGASRRWHTLQRTTVVV